MARRTKCRCPYPPNMHGDHFVDDVSHGGAIVVKGPRPYLWVGDDSPNAVYTFSGRKALRAMAQQILDALGEHDEGDHG